MHIFYVTSSRNASGGSRQALYLARGMEERGHTVHFFSPPTSMLRSLDYAKGLHFIDLPETLGEWKKLLEANIPHDEPVIVHAFHNKALKRIAFLGTLWRMTKKNVACVAHRGVIYPPRNPLPYLLPGIRCFAVNSQACLKTLPLLWRKKVGLVVLNGIPEGKVTPARSPESVRNELGISSAASIIGCVANNTPTKGVDVLIKAFAHAALSEAHLVLVGVREEVWLPLCTELALTGRVHIVPRTENVADYLQVMNLFVLPSRSESSPNTLLEAMCMGLPAIGSNVGGVPECLHDARLLFPAGEPEALSRTIQKVLGDVELLAQSAWYNKEFSKRVSLTARLDTMEGVYQNLFRV